jgi:REP element-mobilizing transposase RayT
VARELRIQYPGARQHVGALGVNHCAVCHDVRDRSVLLALIETAVLDHEWICTAYCLMTSHYHLVVETPNGDLAVGMHWLNGTYAQYFNRRHGRKGHLFGDRYFSREIRREEHALEAPRYVDLNPVRAGICASPEDWQWSSHRALIGLTQAPRWLAVEKALEVFGSHTNLELAQRRYASFVVDAIPSARAEAAASLAVAATVRPPSPFLRR